MSRYWVSFVHSNWGAFFFNLSGEQHLFLVTQHEFRNNFVGLSFSLWNHWFGLLDIKPEMVFSLGKVSLLMPENCNLWCELKWRNEDISSWPQLIWHWGVVVAVVTSQNTYLALRRSCCCCHESKFWFNYSLLGGASEDLSPAHCSAVTFPCSLVFFR